MCAFAVPYPWHKHYTSGPFPYIYPQYMYIKYITNWNILSYYDWPLQMRNFLTISATAVVSHILQPVLLEPQAD